MRTLSIVLVLVLFSCGDDDSPPASPDAGGGRDDGSTRPDADAAPGPDGGTRDDAAVGPDAAPDANADAGEGRDAGPPGACPVGPVGRTIIDDIVAKLMRDTLLVSGHAGPGEAPFALSLPGVDEGYIAFASLAIMCMDESWFIPSCTEGMEGEPPSSPFWAERNRCGRIGCAGPGIVLSDSYTTMRPHTESDDVHAFVYEMADPEGATATFDPNPHAVYRIEPIAGGPYRVTIAVDRALTVRTATDDVMLLAHRGQLTATSESGELLMAEASISFPDLAPPDALTVSLRVAADGTVEGDVRHGDRDVGSYSGSADPGPDHTWSCTD